jgi:hypothetical protein
MKIHKRSPILVRLTVGLLVLLLTGGCSDDPGGTDCEITCSDGFRTTQDGSCAFQISNIIALSRVHGSCNGDEK